MSFRYHKFVIIEIIWNMEQKTIYVAPEAKLRNTAMRCSILVGSNEQSQEQTKPTEAKPTTPGFSFGDARIRKSNSLGF